MAFSITIDLSDRQLNLYNNGTLAKTFSVGIGRMVSPTPTGTYTIVNKVPNPGGPFGVMWMGLSKPTYGIHGTSDPASIGHIVSHGCIRMYNRDVIELSRLVPLGTSVTIIK
jgi:lipoprotein-anchoring transpeptidase ErfK/SrfK